MSAKLDISGTFDSLKKMRERPIYPQQFGEGIPNPVGNATFRGLNADVRCSICVPFVLTYEQSKHYRPKIRGETDRSIISRTSHYPPSDAAPLVEFEFDQVAIQCLGSSLNHISLFWKRVYPSTKPHQVLNSPA